MLPDDKHDGNPGTSEYEDYGKFDASGARGAAGWVLFVSCAGLFFHANVLAFLSNCEEFDAQKHNTVYSVTVSLHV